jgi:hypothetical protein
VAPEFAASAPPASAPPASAPPSSHPITLKVTFHLSTFDEAAPLTAASLQGKAEAVKKKMIEFEAEDVEIVTGKPFLPRCQDMPQDAFLSPERAAALFAEGRRGVRVGSYCWRMPGMPDPDGRTLEKMRGFLNANTGGSGTSGLFVDVACMPQNFAWPSWHAPEAIGRFGPEADQGKRTVLKFELERVTTDKEAQVCVDSLVSLIEENKWAPASIADFKSLGLGSHDHDVSVHDHDVGVLFHGRYRRGVYCFDDGVVYGGGFFQWICAIWRWICAIWRGGSVPTTIGVPTTTEGYMRFRTEGDAKAARQNLELKRMCGGKEPTLMGEHIFENELKFKRGLSVMGCLYASATGTCVLQLTDPPGELGKEVAPDELVSEHTGTVFVVRTDMSLEELREELGDCVLACEKKGRGEVVVRVLGERAARAARSQGERGCERGYPLHRKDRVVYPMYNLRPYGSRGWPTFETSAASMVLAHLTERKRRGGAVPPHVAQAEASSLKFINIDIIGARGEVVVAQSPEHLLRHCKKKLRSKRIFFTGKADRNDVVQLLSDFEDSIAVEFDQKRARHLNLLTNDLERAHTAKLGEARRARSRMPL